MSKLRFIFLFAVSSLLFGLPLVSRGMEVSSPPFLPAHVGSVSFENSPDDSLNDVAVSGNYIYAAVRRYDNSISKFIGALKVFDATDHSAPAEIASFEANTEFNAIFIKDNRPFAK